MSESPGHERPRSERPRPSAGTRQPRQAPQAEREVLGACMATPNGVATAASLLEPGHFFESRHSALYKAILSLYDRGHAIDLVTVGEEVKRQGDLDRVGGNQYVTEVFTSTASGANVEHHARIVLEASYMRTITRLGTEMASRGYDETEDVFEVMGDAEKAIFRLGKGLSEGEPRLLSDGLDSHMDTLFSGPAEGGVTGLDTGLRELNKLTAGWQDTDLVIVAARPSMGKTSFTLQQIERTAETGKTAAMFSLEMGARQLRDRFLQGSARVDSQSMRQRKLSDDQKRRLSRAAEKLADLPIMVDDTPALSIQQLRAKARQLAHQNELGLVVVDYLQLMTGDKSGNREQEINSISQALKALAKELGVPVIANAQLNRGPENRGGNYRPRLSDLRESGAIEQDADVVAFIHRPERYGMTVDENGDSLEGKAEIIVGKQRNGPVGSAWCAFVERFAQFRNYQAGERAGGVDTEAQF